MQLPPQLADLRRRQQRLRLPPARDGNE